MIREPRFSSRSVFQLRIHLRDIEPVIWRRVLVPGSLTLAKLHPVIQGAFDWDFKDIYLGHYHKVAQENMSDGEGAVYWTGSTESGNRYARDSMAASGTPSQRLHFIDPEKGRVSAQYIVWLDD